jgi:hypothetical protein
MLLLQQRVPIHPLLGAQELDSDVPGLCVHLSREDCEKGVPEAAFAALVV